MFKTNLSFLYLKYFFLFRAKSGGFYTPSLQPLTNKLIGFSVYQYKGSTLDLENFKANLGLSVGKNYFNFFKNTLLLNYLSKTQSLSMYPSYFHNTEVIFKKVGRNTNTLGRLGIRLNLVTEGCVTNYGSLQTIKNNTYLPLLSLQNKVKTSFLKKSLITNLFTLQLSQNINSPLFFKLCAAKLIPTFFTHHISYIFKKFKRYGVFFGGPTKLMEFVIISFLTIISKDLTFFNTWLKNKFESIFYRKHKKLLYLIKLFFVNYVSIYLNMFKCCGFYLKIKGKIGVGGNSKKKRYLVRVGRHSLTTKNLKFNNHIGIIRTLVGTLGVKITLFYF